MNRLLIVLIFLTASVSANADKKQNSKFNGNTEEKIGCMGKLCFGFDKEQSKNNRDMFEKIDKSNRIRRADSLSQYNSDDGNDGAQPRFGFSFDIN